MLSVGCACKACVEYYEFMPRLKSHPQAPLYVYADISKPEKDPDPNHDGPNHLE